VIGSCSGNVTCTGQHVCELLITFKLVSILSSYTITRICVIARLDFLQQSPVKFERVYGTARSTLHKGEHN
jgi:hypothetical protein